MLHQPGLYRLTVAQMKAGDIAASLQQCLQGIEAALHLQREIDPAAGECVARPCQRQIMAGADLQRGRRKRDGIGVCAVRAHGIDRALELRRDALQRFACHRAGLPLCLQQRRAGTAEAGTSAACQ